MDESGMVVGRRGLLRAAGVGAAALGAAAFGGTAAHAAPASGGVAAPAVRPKDVSGLPLVGGPDFPIGIFWPPPPYETSVERYQEIADAGFTFVVSGNYADDGNIIGWLLGCADQVGLKVLVSDDTQIRNMTRWFTISDDRSVPMSITSADAAELVRRALDAYAPHQSLAGFNLFDEPWAGIMPSLGRAFGIVRTAAPDLLAYANLLPGTGSGYDTYVQTFVDAVAPSLLSFDRYPIVSSGEDTGYFDNWARIRAHALAAGVPAWTYIQTLAYSGHATPTAAGLAWQVNMSLAYGAKGVQYFTYWTPDPARGEGFGPALITVDGHRSERYADAKKLNTRWLAPVGRVLKPLVSASVQHANESPLPAGAAGFTPDDTITAATGSPVVLGRFTDPNGPARYLLAANRSRTATATSRVTTGSAVTSVARYDATGDAWHPVSAGNLDLSLDPGAAVLLRLT